MEDEDQVIVDLVNKTLSALQDDPIARKLMERSFLTQTQMETLLIHLIADSIGLRPIKYEKKALFRKKTPISKGAFNRSLNQAQKNVIASIYTIILLGYLGILDSPALRPYLELSNHLEEYRNLLSANGPGTDPDTQTLLHETWKMMEARVSELIRPRNVSNRA